MDVFNREAGHPFYRVRSSIEDSPRWKGLAARTFLSCIYRKEKMRAVLPAITDPGLVFGQDTSLSRPRRLFCKKDLGKLVQRRQNTAGKTPCGFFGSALRLSPGENAD